MLWGNNKDYNTLLVAQKSLVQLSKKVKVQLLKPDGRVVVQFSMKVMTECLEPPTWSEINDAAEV